MSEAEKRIRLTVAYDAINNLLKTIYTGESLTRKMIFTAEITRKGVVNAKLFADAMEKTTWQKDLLKKLVDKGWVTTYRKNGTVGYLAVKQAGLLKLVEDIEDERTHVFDAKLHLSALLWPHDVIIPDEDEDADDGAPMESDEEDEEEAPVNAPAGALTVDNPESAPVHRPSDFSLELVNQIQGMLDVWRKLFTENAETLASLDIYTRDFITKQEKDLAEGFASLRKRQNETSAATEALTGGVNGLMRSMKTQMHAEVKAAVDESLNGIRAAILEDVKGYLQPLYTQNQEQAALIQKLLVVHQQVESTKLADMRVTMKALVADMESATAMFLDVTEEVEKNGT